MTKAARIPRRLSRATALGLGLALGGILAGRAPARAQDDTPPAVAAAATSPAAAATTTNADDWIRPEDVAERSDSLLRRIESRKPSPTTLASIQKIEDTLRSLGPDLADAFEQTKVALAGQSSLMGIQDARRELEGASSQFPAWKEQVTAEARRTAEFLDELASAEQRWTSTRARPEIVAAGPAVTKRIDSSLATLASQGVEMKTWQVRVLTLSDGLVESSTAIDDALAKLEAATIAEGSSMLVANRPPLWKRDVASRLAAELPQVPGRYREFQQSTAEYVRLDSRPFVLQALIALALMMLFRRLPEYARRRLELSQVSAETARLLERPYAMALLLALVVSPNLHPTAPHRVMQLFGILALFPVARILMLASQRANLSLYAGLCVLLVLERFAVAFATLPGLSLVLFLAELSIAFTLIFEYRRRLVADDGNPWAIGTLSMGLAALVASVTAQVGGWTTLAGLLGHGVLASGITGLYMYAATISLEALAAYALATPALRHSRFIDANQPLVQRWTARALRLGGAVLWLKLLLGALGLRDIAADAIDSVLNAGVTVGALSLSIGGVLAFVLTLAAVSFTNRLVHEILEDEIFPRTDLPRGLPHALLALTNYTIYSVGFLLALAAAGVQLGQLAILLGGLGVGIGLGLQDLVKNFAAGLTLLLERRVHVGDAVQVPSGDIFGRVLSIGMRASVVRNWNGTEVVIPNDTLVAAAVTNWTLSDQKHRLEVKVGVAYGTDPGQVIALLLEAAKATPGLLQTPPPAALFKGFGDSTLDFALGAWSEQDYETTGAQTSQLALAVHRVLVGAGIEIPFPQRDVNLASVSPQASAALRGGEPQGSDGR